MNKNEREIEKTLSEKPGREHKSGKKTTTNDFADDTALHNFDALAISTVHHLVETLRLKHAA